MLKLKYLFENYDLARECLANYEYEEEKLDEMLSWFRISSNAIYPFNSKNGMCFLRLSPVEEKEFENVLSEIQLINWLIEKGFPVMKPVPMKNGELAKIIDTEWGTYNVSCFSKVTGEDLESSDGSIEVVRGYGQILGKLHELMKEYPYAKQHLTHKDMLDEIGDRIKKYKAPEMVIKEYQIVCDELKNTPISEETYGVIHYDFEADNVFYNPEDKIFSVIDFDDAICCWYALDIVRALDSLDDVVPEQCDYDAEAAFIEGYESVLKLTMEQKQSFSIMRRLVRLQECATILHVLSEPVTEKPDWMEGLINKLNYKLKCLENAICKEGEI